MHDFNDNEHNDSFDRFKDYVDEQWEFEHFIEHRQQRQQPAKKTEPQESMSVGLFLGLLGVFLIVMILILAH